jgi:hypothetical protein
VDLSLTDDERAFRDEVRAFIDEALTPDLRAAGRLATSVFIDPEYSLPWQRSCMPGAGSRRPGRSNTAGPAGAR